jgi:hypothetical protein
VKKMPLVDRWNIPNVMQAEDVSEQLTTIEETILKLAKQERNC